MAWRDLPGLPIEGPPIAFLSFATRVGAAPVPADLLGSRFLWIDTAATAEVAAATFSFLCEEVSRHLATLDALQARVDRCESLIATNQAALGELLVLAVPLLSTFDAEVERVFKVHLQEELASRFYAFLGVERFNFIEFVRNLEDEAFRKISAHFHAARRAHAPSLPASSRVMPPAPPPPLVCAVAASASVAADGSADPWIAVDGGSEPCYLAFRREVFLLSLHGASLCFVSRRYTLRCSSACWFCPSLLAGVRPFLLCIELGSFPFIHPWSLCSIMDVYYFLCGPSVALGSHTVAELMLR